MCVDGTEVYVPIGVLKVRRTSNTDVYLKNGFTFQNDPDAQQKQLVIKVSLLEFSRDMK